MTVIDIARHDVSDEPSAVTAERLTRPCEACGQIMSPDEWLERALDHDAGCESGPCACTDEVHLTCMSW